MASHHNGLSDSRRGTYVGALERCGINGGRARDLLGSENVDEVGGVGEFGVDVVWDAVEDGVCDEGGAVRDGLEGGVRGWKSGGVEEV